MNRLLNIQKSICKDQNSTKEYLKSTQFSILVLSQNNKAQLLDLMTGSYMNNFPYMLALAKKYPQLDNTIETNKRYWSLYLDSFLDQGLSVGVFDTQNNNILIGYMLNMNSGKEIASKPQLKDMYTNTNYLLYYETFSFFQSVQVMHQNLPFLFNQPLKTCYSIYMGVNADYIGQKIMNYLRKVSEQVLKKSGFKYIVCTSTSYVAKKVLEASGLKIGGEYDVKAIQVEVDGRIEFPFSEVKEIDQKAYIFWKEI